MNCSISLFTLIAIRVINPHLLKWNGFTTCGFARVLSNFGFQCFFGVTALLPYLWEIMTSLPKQ